MNANALARALSSALSLPITAKSDARTGTTEFRLEGMSRPHGFSIVVTQLLSRVKAELQLDRLAADLLRVIGEAAPERWLQVAEIARAYESLGAQFQILVNGSSVDALTSKELTGNVRTFACTGSLMRTSVDESNSDVFMVSEALFSFIICLLPLDADQETPPELGNVDFTFASEGQKYSVLATKYERSRANRAAAIAVHGNSCVVCQFSFDESYGDLARGYVEVHHLVPVSSMGGARPVDPITELVPLCANCHRMAHRRWPPYTPQELSEARMHSASTQKHFQQCVGIVSEPDIRISPTES
ncbi:HNH endonuclease [Arthrobacter sp. P2b]|uniref:HNH endonuclease n=1 Tax=Arthrobacter sp. P2b TaxID=1938741 RepID=UPI0009A7BFAA|nr:HNH endonuclease [Arthrobacter sp. P2b]SLK12103.1 5-methylcytosine-specific restriction enzyme A [Arthrobacter sp. P2b]